MTKQYENKYDRIYSFLFKAGIVFLFVVCLAVILPDLRNNRSPEQATSDEDHIHIGMALEDFQKIKCKSFKGMDEFNEKQRVRDERLRKY